MYKRRTEGWLKHLDFIIIDTFALNIGFFIAYLVRHGVFPIKTPNYLMLAAFLTLGDFAYIVIGAVFHGIFRRGFWQEFKSCLESAVFIIALSAVALFFMKTSVEYSRIVVFLTGLFYLLFNYAFRITLKSYLRKNITDNSRNMLIVASRAYILNIAATVQNGGREASYIRGIILLDGPEGAAGYPYPVVANKETMLPYITRNWVDELLVYSDMSKNDSELEEILDTIVESGVAVHRVVTLSSNEKGFSRIAEDIGGYMVITESLRIMTGKQVFLKRCLDIAGGLVGTVLTGLILLVVGPVIKKQSPGPIIFKQHRIGRNGKVFTIYKIRSMYMDAEERKKELMAQNTMKGNMFKLEHDPRIIGSKILPDGSYKKGIGNFIRDYSLDEFPQFINVLKGDMSLVGTRPPTLDEWEKYTPRHRARMTFRPGVTGMWQISGRSDITDFEEVVKLDMQYINNWTPGLDFRILWKTVWNVIRKDGAR